MVTANSIIPNLLSQTWKTKQLPPNLAKLREGWMRQNPSMQCRLYDDADCRKVVADVVPEYLNEYDSLRFPIMRADIFRYAVIFRDGGIYADLDMECLKPIGNFLEAGLCLMAIETHFSNARMRELDYPAPMQIANCVFAAAPQQAIFLAAIHQAFKLLRQKDAVEIEDIEEITGPRMLTRLFFSQNWEGTVLARQIALMAPLQYPNIWPLNLNIHARHQAIGSWKGTKKRLSFARFLIERSRLINPFPAKLFVPASCIQIYSANPSIKPSR